MPWGDCTGPWWMDAGANRASGYWCCGRGMRMVRGIAARRAFMPAGYAVPHQPTPFEEKSYLEDVAQEIGGRAFLGYFLG